MNVSLLYCLMSLNVLGCQDGGVLKWSVNDWFGTSNAHSPSQYEDTEGSGIGCLIIEPTYLCPFCTPASHLTAISVESLLSSLVQRLFNSYKTP